MKAILALIVIYIGTFLVAIQGAYQSPVQAAQQSDTQAQDGTPVVPVKPIDPVKDTDIRSLLDLVGARDQVQDGVNNAADQFREKLQQTVPNTDKGEAFVNAFLAAYQKNLDHNQMNSQLVAIYDKHFSEDDIKGLLQFYGSPIGQKVAAEMPKVVREIQAASRAASNHAAKEAMQTLRVQNPEIGQSARLGFGQRGNQRIGQGRAGQAQQSPQQAPPQQQDPQ